jgi:hypothetical protein
MLFFFAQIAHKDEPSVRQELEKYITEDARYIIAKETAKQTHVETNGEHLHFAVDMTKKEYDAFRKTVLVSKFKLRGKVKNGLPKQYGTVHNVRDEMKMLSYTVKDNNIIYRNIDLKTIQEYIEKSYKKEDKKTYQQDLMDYLKSFEPDYFMETPKSCIQTNNGDMFAMEVQDINFRKIQAEILQHWVVNASKPLSRSQLQFYTNLYLQFHFPQFGNYVYEILAFINGKL